MRALRLHALNESLRLEDVPEPAARPGETLVHMRYASVNPLDIWSTRGGAGHPPLPFIPGVEGVGQIGRKLVLVNGAGVGTQRDGVYCETVSVPNAAVLPLPPGIDPRQAAAVGVAGVTAWRVVHDFAQVTAQDRVLVLGASGGVGSLVVQVVRNAGAGVWGQTSSADKADMIRRLGASGVVVAGSGDLKEAAGDVRPTVVIDSLGNGFTGAAIELLEPFGRLVIFGTSAGERGEVDFRTLYRKALQVRGYGGLVNTDQDRRHAAELVFTEMAARRIQVIVDRVLPLEQANDAFELILNRHSQGKVLLAVKPDEV